MTHYGNSALKSYFCCASRILRHTRHISRDRHLPQWVLRPPAADRWRLYAMTGTGRQAELVKLVAGFCNPLVG
jgi:hypothetical protein